MATPSRWPHPREYQEAVQAPQLCFTDSRLRAATIAVNAMGVPLAISGKSAVVFKGTTEGIDIAIRCFARAVADQRLRYQALHAHLANMPRYMVDFVYRGPRDPGHEYPLPAGRDGVSDGDPLDVWVSRHLQRNEDTGQPGCGMAGRRRRHAAAQDGSRRHRQRQLHGQRVPAEARGLRRLLHPCPGRQESRRSRSQHFQHPNRPGYYASDMDAFPALVIYLSLLALHSDRSLWDRYHTDKNLIFHAEDYRAPRATPIWRDLDSNPDPDVRRLTAALTGMCDAPINSLPPLGQLTPRMVMPLSQLSGMTILPLLLAGATADTVPEPGDGRVRAADPLNIVAEVEMLVSVLLASDTPPPVAVGLFGDWGSGKSFFMALMQERIGELSRLAAEGRPEAASFCREVRQVRFNAWHYADANLWASLAATLFDELALAGAPDRTQTELNDLDEARGEARKVARAAEELARAPAAGRRPASRHLYPLAIRAVRGTPVIESCTAPAKGTLLMPLQPDW